ncbi:ribosome small subunit-dependent GTPase A [Vibrio fluvialis]|uniref:ribosome small subunit-dependent GTPase A n=1 Tax=Vibrio fluvialis TaxID=676 RepID=UPI001EEB8C89|nr:ribosome small subunit-dependent GTPase A [Vibrio fluvialis]EKO3489880.1 ribosome small subunit-dependent GTPase A [Vibrio fluvialis]EKO3918954.1 ribosome small subunit-dependent GTPase A [Vibrio fluvialis]ELE2163410.1 ribosome small subunit-dependent GTPase A [Vibrio fluvialis]MCG6401631.1 ribosome small subunit-dependent GTPase A [Vibrio fluvialis]
MSLTDTHSLSLPQLGWRPVFQQQLSLEDMEHNALARVAAHHRSGYVCWSEQGEFHLDIHAKLPAMTVGDWIVIDHSQQFVRLLDRQSLFSRKAAGNRAYEQLIAANVDTVFIVSSLNQDFNLSRIERYLALAREAQVEPVIVLSKADLCDDTEDKRRQVQDLSPLLSVETINALNNESCQVLHSWCKIGRTIAVMGSSGVGKSTLVNTLMGEQVQETGGIREQDSKGRHTTTARFLLPMPSGALLLDTPGMRELQIADCEHGVAQTFADVESLAQQCRFSDCRHQSEPGCAVNRAVESGELDARRLKNYQKLLAEQLYNSETIAERHARHRRFSKMVRNAQNVIKQP